jgi:hypothetical protein
MAVSWKVLLEWLWYGGRRHLQCGWEYAISTACAQSTDTRKKCSASLNLHSRRCRVVHEGFEFLLCVLDLRNISELAHFAKFAILGYFARFGYLAHLVGYPSLSEEERLEDDAPHDCSKQMYFSQGCAMSTWPHQKYHAP